MSAKNKSSISNDKINNKTNNKMNDKISENTIATSLPRVIGLTPIIPLRSAIKMVSPPNTGDKSPVYGTDDHKQFEIICTGENYINDVSILANDNRLKGIHVNCSDNKTEFYGGTPIRKPSNKTSIKCLDAGFTDMNIYELLDNSKQKGGISGVGFYCNRDELLPLANDPANSNYAKYYSETPYAHNAVKHSFQCSNGNKIIGLRGSYEDDNMKSLQVICKEEMKPLSPSDSTKNSLIKDPWFWVSIVLMIILLIIILIVIIRNMHKRKIINFSDLSGL